MGKLQTRLNGIARRLAELNALRNDAADYPPAPLPVRYYELDAVSYTHLDVYKRQAL